MKEKNSEIKRWRAVYLAMFFMMLVCMNVKPVQAGSYESATVLSANGNWSEEKWITDSEEEQWYRVTIPSDGKVTITMMAYTYARIEYYVENLETRLDSKSVYGDSASPQTTVTSMSLSKGIYYMKVSGSNGKHKVKAAFASYNANDSAATSYESPQTITLNTSVTGAHTKTDEVDWFKIQIPKSGYYHYNITSWGYVYHELRDADLVNRINYGYNYGSETSPSTNSYDVVLSKGTHYFKITGSGGKYMLTVTALSQSSCNHNYKLTWVSPTYVSKGYTLHECSKCGKAYKDNYRAKIKLSTPYIYSPNAAKRKIRIHWGTITDASGYQICYKVGGSKTYIKVKGQAKSKKLVKNLKRKKKYVFRVRAYRKENGKTVYSAWSAKEVIRTR